MRALLVALATTVLLALANGSASAQQTPDSPPPTAAPDAPVADTEPDHGCRSVWGVGGGVCDAVSGVVDYGLDSIVSTGAGAVLRHLVDFVVDGAGWLLGQVTDVLDRSTRPALTSGWFSAAYRDMALVAGLGLLPFLLLAFLQGLLRQDAAMLLRAGFVHVPLAAIGTAGAVVVVDALVQVTDALAAWVGRSLGDDLAGFATSVGHALSGLGLNAGGSVASFAILIGAIVVAFAAFVIWLELLLRQAAIYVAVLFLPMAFTALVWPATAHWLRRLVQGLVAVILSKFVIVAVMALAASALAAEVPDEGYGTVIAGGAMLSLAALAPYVLLRFIPVFEAGLSSQFEGTVRRPTSAVAAPVPHGSRVVSLVQQRVGATKKAGAAAAAGGGAATTARTAGWAGQKARAIAERTTQAFSRKDGEPQGNRATPTPPRPAASPPTGGPPTDGSARS